MKGKKIKTNKVRKRKEHTEIDFNGQIYHAFFEKSNVFIYASRFINLVQVMTF